MDLLLQSFDNAELAWQQAILELGWGHGVVAVAYFGVAWLCWLGGHVADNARETSRPWHVAAILICLMGINAILHGDVWVAELFRSMAKLEGWYDTRREMQYQLLTGLAVLGLLVAGWLFSYFDTFDESFKLVLLGLLILLMLALLRAVSAHQADVVLNLSLAGLSIARLLELGGIGLVASGAWRYLRVR